MTKYIPLLLLSLVLMGQEDCEETQPDEPKGIYCDGATEPGAIATVGSYITGTYAAIVDGHISSDRKASVRVNLDGGGWCSGTVIGPHTVVSAAHCAGDHYWLVFGYEDAPPSQSVGYSEYYFAPYSKRHEKYIDWAYQESRDNDILLIYTDEVLPGPYASIYTSSMHSECTGLTAGPSWGRHGDDDCAWHNNCSMRESPNYAVAEGPTWVSTRGMPGWICSGDSGGPLYADVPGAGFPDEHGNPSPILAGITSSTSSMDCKRASRFIKLEPFVPWLNANRYEREPWESQIE